MAKNDFLSSVILTRLSVRHFTGEPVAKETLKEILKAAMAAPSAVNTQPWAFIVVTKREILDQLCAGLPYAKMLDKAGAAIIVCGLPQKNEIAQKYWIMDCSAATENILLAAHALGLGAVWTAVYPDTQRIEFVRKILQIPQEVIPLNVIPLGVTVNEEKPKNKYREENIHWETW